MFSGGLAVPGKLGVSDSGYQVGASQGKATAGPPTVDTENSVRIENAGFRSVREINPG